MRLLHEYLDIAKNPVLLLSGGRDSVYLLSEIRKLRGDIDCICFAADFTKEQWRIIENLVELWNLEVYVVAPRHTYLIPNGEGQLARVDEFGLGNLTFPVVRDIAHDDSRCLLEMSEDRSAGLAPWNYDVVFTGTRKSDRSYATGRPFQKDVVSTNGTTFVAPLWDMTDSDIDDAVRGLPFDFPADERLDSGNLISCSRCFDTEQEQVLCPKTATNIETINWAPDKMLSAFRQKYGFSGE